MLPTVLIASVFEDETKAARFHVETVKGQENLDGLDLEIL